ncbi:MAG TPA: zinc-binding alcohol dehydrogenase family protein [Kofleriaceae bacterium]|nr:zinc-binding alcohol dehydrogenase family protein [Kofleriaceae bacterium]
MARQTRAIVMRAFGGPDVLRPEGFPLPPLGPAELRIRTLAAAVNHSDLEVRSGAWPLRRADALPYVPGLEVLGEVSEVGSEVGAAAGAPRVGDRVITMMQGLGGVRAERAGGYQHEVTVSADVVAPVPAAVDPLAAAALGLAAVTAHEGLARLGSLAGRTLVVTGAAGGVGSAACALGAAMGARIVAVVRAAAPEAAAYLRGLGVAQIVTDPAELGPRSVDAVLDSVVGPLLEPLIAALADGGRYCMVGAMAGDRAAFSAWELLRGLVITGYSSETLDGPALRAATAAIFERLLRGELLPPVYETLPLSQAAEAHRRIEARGVRGRVLLVPDPGTA